MSRILISGLLALSLSAHSQEKDAVVLQLNEEIAKLQKEMVRVQKERQQLKDLALKDRQQNELTRKSLESRQTQLRSQLEIESKEMAQSQLYKDSLAALSQNLVQRDLEIELRRKNWMEEQMRGIQLWSEESQFWPPLVRERLGVHLRVLNDEVRSGKALPEETWGRITQIGKEAQDASRTVQVVQGTCPLPSMGSKCWRLRYGLLGEAAIEERKGQYAYWTGVDANGVSKWELGQDPIAGQEILRAVHMNQGKAVPALIPLNFLRSRS